MPQNVQSMYGVSLKKKKPMALSQEFDTLVGGKTTYKISQTNT